ncbi:ATP-dependent helicase HrpB [Lichenicoccus roseus]|uniref:RNA helicase n=1 Tax=Lichenicoccus roseus TaxID=2683649 RepID=A0A5R9J7G3_9PROT|nr:ATP-dependent helicase HrpB [Lichenicoccus roseus]TLU73564.1 ATP-dependent helicase HrpB [Lichenicoccus roseus]
MSGAITLSDALVESLPVSDALPALLAALGRDEPGTGAAANVVLIAPPGAGKTTLVPLALLGAGWLGDRKIVMLEPRRLATRAAAHRMASLIGQQAGELVGYRTRIDHAVSARTRIEVVTEGLLVRRLLADPLLDGVGCVILDEVHERSLDGDLALAFCLDLQRTLRPELRLLAMSATVDGAALSARLQAPVIESAGRLFEVEVRHAARDPTGLRDLPDAMARTLRGLLADPATPPGDILAFLPGVGEIRRVAAALAGVAAHVLPLHGELPPAQQDLVLQAPAGDRARRIVLATSIAETSLTVPGVRIVVDGGWRRAPRLDAGSGLSRLETLRISRAAAAQRSGRAGREAPGLAVRLWTTTTQRSLALHDRPEIFDAELSGLRLDVAAWTASMGTTLADLPLPDPPPNGASEAARSLLADLGAFDSSGAITEVGQKMATLGAHPRLAAMMLAARNAAERALAADLAALLEERDPLRPRPGSGVADPPVDIALRLALLAGADAPHADRASLARIRQSATQFRRRLGTSAPAHGDVAGLLAAAFPDRVAQRRGEPGAFRLSGGGSARLGRDDALAGAGLLVAAALQVRTAAQIRLAAALDPDALPASLLARTTEQVESALDPVSGAVLSRRRTRLGALVLRDRTVAADPDEVAALLAATAARNLRATLDWSEAACQLQARVAVARRAPLDDLGLGAALPDLSDPALAERAQDWLAPRLAGCTKLADLGTLDLHALLRAQLDPRQAASLDRALPTHLDLGGSRAAIDYTGPEPLASARAQAFYGLTVTPTLAQGRVRLRLALLSPAGRPAAITGDLASFWTGAWIETRKDLRGRYPKHDWPENPALSSRAGAGHPRTSQR